MRPALHRQLRAVHKYAGLIASAWLLVLALTGIALDHHEWRWLNQNSVPAAWTSKQIGRLVPASIMRYIAVDGGVVVGASERGTWRSDDRGKVWKPVSFVGLDHTPQVYGFAELNRQGFAGLYMATDEGLWAAAADGKSAHLVALGGDRLTSISPGSDIDSLLVVRAESEILRVMPATAKVSPIALGNQISGLTLTVPFDRVVRDIHFGRGLLPGAWSIRLNDLGGIAMMILAVTGIGYWWITRSGRRSGMSMHTQRQTMRWLFRFHGPLIGLIAALPILYLSVTAIPLNHIYGFIAWAEGRHVLRANTPPAFHGTSLGHEIEGIAAWPGDPARITIATAFGLLESRDGGRKWQLDRTVPQADGAPGANLFRVEDRVFAGIGGGRNLVRAAADGAWQKLTGPSAAVTGASRDGTSWFVKNSRSIFTADGNATALTDSRISAKSAIAGTPLFLFMADLHAGVLISEQFKWLNDLFAILAVALALSGPLIWLKRKWI